MSQWSQAAQLLQQAYMCACWLFLGQFLQCHIGIFQCGKIIAYQFGAPDAFGDSGRGSDPTIDTYYVDGVSLTHESRRHHIWAFAAGLDEVGTCPDFNCPCTNTELASQASQPPAFVGNDYFCDTGSSRRIDCTVRTLCGMVLVVGP